MSFLVMKCDIFSILMKLLFLFMQVILFIKRNYRGMVNGHRVLGESQHFRARPNPRLVLTVYIQGSPSEGLKAAFLWHWIRYTAVWLWASHPNARWQFAFPLCCGGSSLWVGLDGWLVKVSWLGKLVSGAWSWISSLWSAIKCPGVSFEMPLGLVWLWAACILTLRAVFLCCWRICVVCLALELVVPWVVLGFSVGMEAFDGPLSINVPWSQEFPGLRVWS